MAAVARLKKTISKTVKSIGPSGSPRRRYRTIWISDIHLGTRGCNDRLLIDFFEHVNSDTLYLRSEEHTSELQSLMRISYAVFCLKKKNNHIDMKSEAVTE